MKRRHSLLPLVLVVPLVARAEDKPQPPPDPKVIQQLVEQLGSDDFDTREKAGARLLELEEAAMPALKRAAEGSDAELRRSAGELLATITARVEDRAVQKMLVEVNREGLEKFVERMAKDKEFATEERWRTVGHLVLAIEKRATEVADRSFRVTKLDVGKMTTLQTPPENIVNTARIVLNNDPLSLTGLYNCVVISNGPLGRVGTFTNCVVIVNGDIEGFTIMRNCVVLCRGNIGRTRQIDSSIVLATALSSADTIHGSLIEVGSVGRCWKSINSVYLNLGESPGSTSTDDQCIQTKRGPLHMFTWTAPPEKKPEPTPEKK
jgi:hypothetical protein